VRFDFRDLELFVAVADSGSIARAAERSHTVASAVSKRLSDLEQTVGTALVVRGAKGVQLTAAGHALLIRARALLHQADQLDDELRKHAAGTQGHVRVFANISAIVEFLPRALASFIKSHPDIHIHLEEHVSTAVAQGVVDNLADIGIVSDLPGIDGLESLPFRTDELVLIAPSTHAIAKQTTAAFSAVVDEPFIGFNANSALNHLLERAALEAGSRLKVRIRVTSFDAACAMVAAGLGISIIPKGATTPYVESLKLASLSLSDAWAQRQLFICTRANESLPAAARLFHEHLRKPAR
jgi:DNA-binding transcriptional LysR family regulator